MGTRYGSNLNCKSRSNGLECPQTCADGLMLLWLHRSLTFTCSVDKCGERSTHEFAKRSYTKGIVIVQCPGCKNRYVPLPSSSLLPHIML